MDSKISKELNRIREERLLVDIIRDKVPNNKNMDYKFISRSLKVLNINISPMSLLYSDKKFKIRVSNNIWLNQLKPSNPDELLLDQEKIKRKLMENKEKHIMHVIKSHLGNKLKNPVDVDNIIKILK